MPTYSALVEAFRAFDYNGDGIISADEFLGILQRDGDNAELDGSTAQMILNSIAKHDGGKHDTDGDGQISVEELAMAMADEEEPDHAAPVLSEMCAVFQKELGIDKGLPLRSCVKKAAVKVGVPEADMGLPLAELAKRTWLKYKSTEQKV